MIIMFKRVYEEEFIYENKFVVDNIVFFVVWKYREYGGWFIV